MADLVKTPILGQSFGDIRKLYALTQRGAWSLERLSSIVSALRKTSKMQKQTQFAFRLHGKKWPEVPAKRLRTIALLWGCPPFQAGQS